jgi:hypothetical protein
VPLEVTANGSSIRFQVYLNTPGTNFDLDGAQLTTYP